MALAAFGRRAKRKKPPAHRIQTPLHALIGLKVDAYAIGHAVPPFVDDCQEGRRTQLSLRPKPHLEHNADDTHGCIPAGACACP